MPNAPRRIWPRIMSLGRSAAGLVRLLGPRVAADEFVASASVASEPPVCPHGAVSSDLGGSGDRLAGLIHLSLGTAPPLVLLRPWWAVSSTRSNRVRKASGATAAAAGSPTAVIRFSARVRSLVLVP